MSAIVAADTRRSNALLKSSLGDLNLPPPNAMSAAKSESSLNSESANSIDALADTSADELSANSRNRAAPDFDNDATHNDSPTNAQTLHARSRSSQLVLSAPDACAPVKKAHFLEIAAKPKEHVALRCTVGAVTLSAEERAAQIELARSEKAQREARERRRSTLTALDRHTKTLRPAGAATSIGTPIVSVRRRRPRRAVSVRIVCDTTRGSCTL